MTSISSRCYPIEPREAKWKSPPHLLAWTVAALVEGSLSFSALDGAENLLILGLSSLLLLLKLSLHFTILIGYGFLGKINHKP
ncbi:hypothetical protein KFK09_009435 [Dendrobium nobile]|uniref:Uncharacterized protein n=1 Tax=Dendrobium nobile TaxID=94219 RepID=A0A8T3BJY0_DENNO|nr:hypothetical protein KFK09_009435 [Dendrobium nobile]